MLKVWLLSFLTISIFPFLGAATECNADPDSSLPQYIVGYGSLMETASKRRTAPLAGENLPILLQGFQRGWYLKSKSITLLGAIVKENAQMNAVIYRLPLVKELLATDRRESGYCRYAVPSQKITMLDRSVVPQGQVWIYMIPTEKVSAPTLESPIVQSYVDLVIGGCLEIEETFSLQDFAKKCVETTEGWSPYWVNDRIYPRRPFIYQPKAGAIDGVLRQTIPEILQKRKIE